MDKPLLEYILQTLHMELGLCVHRYARGQTRLGIAARDNLDAALDRLEQYSIDKEKAPVMDGGQPPD